MKLLLVILLFFGSTQLYSQGGSRNMRVVPPDDVQTGGVAILEALTPHDGSTNMFVNQTFDLSLIGPGSNLSFVMSEDGEDWGFSFSNGRFEDINHLAGSVEEGTYPLVNYSSQEGKYSWPVDADGNYLPFTLTNESNGPHDHMQRILEEKSKSKRNYFAGHIGIDAKGNAYIGYISASVNKGLSRESWGIGGSPDERSLPPQFRKALHDKFAEVFKGREIQGIVNNANAELETGNRVKNFSKFFPADPYHAQENPINSTFQYLRERLKGKEFEKYLFRADPRSIGHVFTSHDFVDFVKEGMRYQHQNLSGTLPQRKVEIYNAVETYIDNFTTDDPKKLGNFLSSILSHKGLHEVFSSKLKNRFIDIISKAPPEFFEHLNETRYVLPKILMNQEEFIELAKNDPDIAAGLYKHIVNKDKPHLQFPFNINNKEYEKLRSAVTKHHFGLKLVDSETFFKLWVKLDPNLPYDGEPLDEATFKAYLEKSDPKKIGSLLANPELKFYISSGKLINESDNVQNDWKNRKQIYNAVRDYILNFESNYPEKKGKFVAHILANRDLRNTFGEEAIQKFSEIINEGSPDFTKYLNSINLNLPDRLMSEQEFINLAKINPDLAAGLYPHFIDNYSAPIDFGFELVINNNPDYNAKYSKLRGAMLRHHFGHIYLNRHSFFDKLFDDHPGRIFEELISEDFNAKNETSLFKTESFTDIDIEFPQKDSKTVQTFYYFMNRAKLKLPLDNYDKAFLTYIVKYHNESMLQNLFFFEGPMRNHTINLIMQEPNGAEKLAKGLVMSDSYYGTLSTNGRREVIKAVLNSDLLPPQFRQQVIKEMLIHGSGFELRKYLNLSDDITKRAIGDFIIHFDEMTKSRYDITITKDLNMSIPSVAMETIEDPLKRMISNATEIISEIRKNDQSIGRFISDYRINKPKDLINIVTKRIGDCVNEK
ncbi:hypothetical protein N9N67_02005 [Bacteriovoracaceae bacterium]|nr:hypothetical protein [Bacteriovoracaceae bacterium]